jgi:urea transport system ATP-binding protein
MMSRLLKPILGDKQHDSDSSSLHLHGVVAGYGSVDAINDIDMTLPEGEITCVMGRNGVGKTTLMKAIMGILPLRAGTIHVGEQDVSRLRSYKRARRGVALVPQGRRIFPKLSVGENLRVGLQAAGQRGSGVPEMVYELFPVLKEMHRRMGGDLSGGQQQQLAIARALVGRPRVLLLDEPTEGIQPNVIQHIGQVLRQLKDEMGITTVVVEQYLGFVREYGQNYYIMDRGRVVSAGQTEELSEAIVSQHLSV